jgi:hypothetical protein
MALLPQQFARYDGVTVEVRSEPLRVGWLFEDIPAADSHVLRIRFTCSAGVANTAADRRMFREVFLGLHPHVMAEDVVAHFAGALRKAAINAAAAHSADEWVTTKTADMQVALANAAKSVAFACGLEVLAPFEAEIDSPTLHRHRIESIERQRAEERVAGQVQHFQRAAELAKQFQALREQMPDLSPGELLEHVSPVDRGSTLQSLLIANAKQGQPQKLWAVAGPQLVRIDGGNASPKTDLISLPTSAGPLRSVQPGVINGRHLLLVGARSGVMVVSPDSPAETTIYTDPTVTSQLGFNRVVARDGEIWASHGEAGVVGWKVGQTGEPFARFSAGAINDDDPPPAPLPTVVSVAGSPSLVTTTGSRGQRVQGPRNLQVLDEAHLVYSIGNDVVILPRDGQPTALPAESNAEVVAILPAGQRTMLLVHADSAVARLSTETRAIVDRQRRSGRVCAAGALPWLDTVRMLLVDTDGAIDCVGFDDPLITQYVSQHRGLRLVAASQQLVAAISSDRQRIILWNSWDGRAPCAEVHVTGIARHRVADVEFA